MLLDKPYFLKNKEWYIINEGIPKFLGGTVKKLYTLTDKAPQKAIDSYNKYYEMIREKKMTDIPQCFLCKYYQKSLTKCIKYSNIPKYIYNGDRNCKYYEKDAKI